MADPAANCQDSVLYSRLTVWQATWDSSCSFLLLKLFEVKFDFGPSSYRIVIELALPGTKT